MENGLIRYISFFEALSFYKSSFDTRKSGFDLWKASLALLQLSFGFLESSFDFQVLTDLDTKRNLFGEDFIGVYRRS